MNLPTQHESQLTLNREKSALISLLDDCDEFVAIDDIDVSSSSILLRQMSSSFVATFFAELVPPGGNTESEREKQLKIGVNNEKMWKNRSRRFLCNERWTAVDNDSLNNAVDRRYVGGSWTWNVKKWKFFKARDGFRFVFKYHVNRNVKFATRLIDFCL